MAHHVQNEGDPTVRETARGEACCSCCQCGKFLESREGAATVDVDLGIGEMRYEQSTTERGEVEFEVDTPITEPALYLLLFRYEDGTVFAARSGALASPIPPLKVG